MRCRYRFTVVGYVVMPEHFHLLMSESETRNPSTLMQVLKQRVVRATRQGSREADCGHHGVLETGVEQEDHFWQRRFHDFNVWSASKEREKLIYMHYNPVKRGLVSRPEHWAWSSARDYAGEKGRPVKVNQ